MDDAWLLGTCIGGTLLVMSSPDGGAECQWAELTCSASSVFQIHCNQMHIHLSRVLKKTLYLNVFAFVLSFHRLKQFLIISVGSLR